MKNKPKEGKKCKHGVNYAFDEYGNAWTDCKFCKPMKPKEKKIEINNHLLERKNKKV